MILQDLPVGENVSLEIVWGDGHYTVSTQVVGKSEEGALLAPLQYEGEALQLKSNRYKNITFNMYSIDHETKTRVSWKNITIDTVTIYEKCYYLVKISGFRQLAINSERRQKKRIPLKCSAMVYPQNGNGRIMVQMNDISDGGLSFILPKEAKVKLDGHMTVMFEDQIRGHHFSMAIDCAFVHRKSKDDTYIYGCSFGKIEKNVLAYVCLKKMEYYH